MKFFQYPERDYVYELISSYYDDPIMIKIKNVDRDTFAMYAIQLPCLLMNEKRFLIALTLNDQRPEGTNEKLSDLRWTSFMIRSLNDETLVHLPIHRYSIKRDHRYTIPLQITFRNKEISTYKTEMGVFLISLLHTKNQEYEYPNEGNLVSALETFQTVIGWEK